MITSFLKIIFLILAIDPMSLEGIDLLEEDLQLENGCRTFESFYKTLRKDLVESTKNPFKFLLTVVGRGNEYGKENLSIAQAEFNDLVAELNIDQTDFEKDFAFVFAKQFEEMPFCMEVSDAVTFVFKLLKFKFLKDKKANFLKTFLSRVAPAFKIRFILYTLENVMECDEELTKALLDNYYESESDFIDEFIRLYETVLDLHSQTDQTQWQKTYKNSVTTAITQGKAFLGIFLLYQFKGLFADQFGEYSNFFIDHFVLCKVSAFLTSIISDVGSPKKKSLIADLSSYFTNVHDRQLKSKNILEIENTITMNNKIADDCPQCFAKRLAEKQLASKPVKIKI